MSRCLLAVLLLSSATLFSQTFTYSKIDVPGAVTTEARGINTNGEIVGFYRNAACQDYDIKVPSCHSQGFKYVNGKFIKLMVPNSASTAIMGVNDLGDLVGFYTKFDGKSHGFIWTHQNVIKTIDHPGWISGTVPFGINKAGTVVGGVWGIGSIATFPSGGWIWKNGTFSNMDPFQKSAADRCCWSVNGIANIGVLVGEVFQFDFHNAWFKEAADADFFMDVPSGQNGHDTFAMGINSARDVVGYSFQGWFAPHIEANEGSNDASETKPKFIAVKFPNSRMTIPFGINELRGVVGTYADSSGKLHGFVAKPNF